MQAARGSLRKSHLSAELIKDVTSEYQQEVMELTWGWLARTMTDTTDHWHRHAPLGGLALF